MSKTSARKISSKLLSTTTIAVGLVASLLPSQAYAIDDLALPQNGQVVGGSANITNPSAGYLNVKQNSDRVVINWDSFNIGKNATTEFVQNNGRSLAVNRVTGDHADPTQILGTLKANGRVMVLDRNGVFFGKDAVLDVGGIVASTGDVDTGAVMSGATKLELSNFGNGAVVNEGTINVQDAGLAAFVAPTVKNSGVINAKLGKVALAAGGERATVDLYGDGLVEIALDQSKTNALVENAGTINAQGGAVALTASAAKEAIDDVINTSGVIDVSSVEVKGGKIILSGGTSGKVKVSGKVKATGKKGGSVTVTGQAIELAATAHVDASGQNGGGDIKIGGDYQGTGTTQRSSATIVQKGAVINNDAIENGDGGQTIIWSDGLTAFGGTATSKGGALSGDGGLVEVSGLKGLTFRGLVDTTALYGKVGTLLLDPRDIEIRLGERGGDNTDWDDIVADYADGDLDFDSFELDRTFRIYESDIEAQSLLSDIIIRARRSIAVASDTYGVSDGIVNINGNNLLLETSNDIVVDGGTTHTNAGAIDLTGNSTYGANLLWKATGNGNITVNAAVNNQATGNIILSALETQNGNISVNTNKGSVRFAGNVTTQGGDVVSSSTTNTAVANNMTTNGGDVNLTAGGGLTISGGSHVNAGAGDIDLQSKDRLFLLNGARISGDNVNLVSTNHKVEQQSLGSVTAKVLTGSSKLETVLNSAANKISKLGNFTTGGFSLVNNLGARFDVVGAVKADSGDVSIKNNGEIRVVSSGSIVTQGGDINVSNTGAAKPIYIQGVINAGSGDVTFDSTSDITMNAGSNITANELTLISGNYISQAAGDKIAVNKLTGAADKGASFLGSANTIASLGNFATELTVPNTGGFKLNNNGALAISGDVTTQGGDINVTTTGALTAARSIKSNGGDIKLDAGTTMSLAGTSNVAAGAGSVDIDAVGNILLINGGKIQGDKVDIRTTKTLRQQGLHGITANELSGKSGQATILEGNNTIAKVTGFETGSATNAGGFILENNGALAISGAVTTQGGDIYVETTGDLAVTGAGLVNANGGDIELDQTGVFSSVNADTLKTKGTGTIDIQQNAGGSINNAIRALDNVGTGLNTVLVGDGTYADNAVIDQSNLDLVSRNGHATTTTASLQVATGVNNVNIGKAGQGFTVKGGAGTNAAIDLLGSNDTVHIEHNVIDAADALNAVSSIDGSNITINDNAITGTNARGVFVKNSDGLHIINNTIHDLASSGIEIEGGKRVVIRRNDVQDVGGNGIAVAGARNVIVRNNDVTNAGGNGLDLRRNRNVTVDRNDIENAGRNGVLLRNNTNATLADNVINNSAVRGLFVAGANNGSVVLIGNEFNDNTIGAEFRSGEIDITGLENTINGGNVGLRFDQRGPLSLVGRTFGTTFFNGQAQYYIELANGAFFAPGNPTVLDATTATFDGFRPDTVPYLTLTQYNELNAKLFDYKDNNGLGLIFTGLVPEIDQEDIFRQIAAYRAGAGGLSITIRGLPMVNANTALRAASGANTALALANIAPAAGGDDADSVANIEPAAGGDEPSEQTTCWSDAAAGAAGGATVSYSFGGSSDSILSSAGSCQSGSL